MLTILKCFQKECSRFYKETLNLQLKRLKIVTLKLIFNLQILFLLFEETISVNWLLMNI